MIDQRSAEMTDRSAEEVAAWLSMQEGRNVTVLEVRRIEAQALRKLRKVMQERCLRLDDLLPGR